MAVLLRFRAILALAIKRLITQPTLTAASLLGLVLAFTLSVSISIYAEGSYTRALRAELSRSAGDGQRPPFAFTFHYLGSWAGALDWPQVEALDRYVSERVSVDLGLPRQLLVRSLRTGNFVLYPRDTLNYSGLGAQLAAVRYATLSDLVEHIQILEGAFPQVASPQADTAVEVLVTASMANASGLQVGEEYLSVLSGEDGTLIVPVRIAGVWAPNAMDETYWFRDPAWLDTTLFVPEATFFGRLGTQVNREIVEAVWYLVADGDDVHPSNVGELIGRIVRVQSRVASLLPQTIVNSPLQILQRYQGIERLLAIMLFTFSLPIMGLNLLFISLVARMAAEERKREIAMLLSRGATRNQLIGAALLEGLLLCVLSLLCSLPMSLPVARIMGRTRTFLDFGAQSDLPINITLSTLRLSALAIGFGLLARVLPTLRASRETIVGYQQERSRSIGPATWQRLGLDLLLLAPAIYGGYLLKQQSNLVVFVDRMVAKDPFQNPLLFLVPSLTIMAVTLLILRLVPLFMRLISWLASRTQSVSFLLAARQLSRSTGFYAAPTILLIVTLSLSVFISTAARALDDHLYTQIRYQSGAEMIVAPEIEIGQSQEEGAVQAQGSAEEADAPEWFFVPLEDYISVAGVYQAGRVAHFRAAPEGGGMGREGTFMGVERASFTNLAYWRSDFATESLGGLMNALATTRNGVLLPGSFMWSHGLSVGDSLRLTVTTYGTETELLLRVVGSFDLFPTWDPNWGLLFVGNLDYLFEQVGTELPASVWLKLNPTVPVEQIKAQLYELNPYAVVREPTYQRIVDEQGRPEHQGLFGVLSVGFLATSLLTLVGFLLYTLFSFRRRLTQLGILRAIGLSFWQMANYVVWELTLLVLVGLIGGTVLGVGVSQLFVPYLNMHSSSLAQVLPISVRIAWPALFLVYGLFGLLVTGIFGLSTILLQRAKLFQTVKLIEEA